MKAYTQGITKEQFVTEMKWHQKMDNFIKGTYGKRETQACSVGCALKSVAKIKSIQDIDTSNHKLFEPYLGIPEWLARLNDTIFEGVTEARTKTWPVEFSEAINEGADLDKVKTPFLIFILEDALKSIQSSQYDKEIWPEVKNAVDLCESAVKEMIRCHREGLDLSAAESAAESAARSARSAARPAWSAARSAARSVTWSASSAAESAAESARLAVGSAARLAWSASWSAARSAERSAAYEEYADKLLELIRECR